MMDALRVTSGRSDLGHALSKTKDILRRLVMAPWLADKATPKSTVGPISMDGLL
jgi:hypothetical protein